MELTDEEAEALQPRALPVHGDDRAAASRDIFFTWWEERFLGAARNGAPAIGGGGR